MVKLIDTNFSINCYFLRKDYEQEYYRMALKGNDLIIISICNY